MKKVIRDMSTEENRAFWSDVQKTAAEVETRPDWKRAGINVSQTRSEPRSVERVVEVRCPCCGR